MKIGIIADIHYSPYPAAEIERHTTEGLERTRQFIEGTKDCDFLINLGDTINGSSDFEANKEWLKQVNDIFEDQPLTVYHVVGNHDVVSLSRKDIISTFGMPSLDYSFKHGDVRFIVLDTNYTHEEKPIVNGYGDWTETYLTQNRCEWLKEVLAKDDFKWAVVICHQCVDDRPNGEQRDVYALENCAEVRKILEDSGKVRLVLTGHDHNGRLRPINGIMYYAQPGACISQEANYGILSLDPETGKFGIEPHGIKVKPFFG